MFAEASDGQASAPDRPVPRGSMSRMSRRLRSGASRSAQASASAIGPLPGPPGFGTIVLSAGRLVALGPADELLGHGDPLALFRAAGGGA